MSNLRHTIPTLQSQRFKRTGPDACVYIRKVRCHYHRIFKETNCKRDDPSKNSIFFFFNQNKRCHVFQIIIIKDCIVSQKSKWLLLEKFDVRYCVDVLCYKMISPTIICADIASFHRHIEFVRKVYFNKASRVVTSPFLSTYISFWDMQQKNKNMIFRNKKNENTKCYSSTFFFPSLLLLYMLFRGGFLFIWVEVPYFENKKINSCIQAEILEKAKWKWDEILFCYLYFFYLVAVKSIHELHKCDTRVLWCVVFEVL